MTDDSRKLWGAKDPGPSVHRTGACLRSAAHTPGSLAGRRVAWGCPSLPRTEWGPGGLRAWVQVARSSHESWKLGGPVFSVWVWWVCIEVKSVQHQPPGRKAPWVALTVGTPCSPAPRLQGLQAPSIFYVK